MVEQRWLLVENPAWAGRAPPAEPLTESACHDHSHFITIQCACGEHMHLHETVLESVPDGHGLASMCRACHTPLVFEAGTVPGMFAHLRSLGWII